MVQLYLLLDRPDHAEKIVKVRMSSRGHCDHVMYMHHADAPDCKSEPEGHMVSVFYGGRPHAVTVPSHMGWTFACGCDRKHHSSIRT